MEWLLFLTSRGKFDSSPPPLDGEKLFSFRGRKQNLFYFSTGGEKRPKYVIDDYIFSSKMIFFSAHKGEKCVTVGRISDCFPFRRRKVLVS
jgi:hypothetical protein